MSNEYIKTGELSQEAGVNKETLRFYERKGLLEAPKRTEAGYRLFTQADVERVKFIKNAQKLGFSLNEIRELLAIADGEVVKCSEVRKIAEEKLLYIHDQIQSLYKLEQVLADLISQCKKADTISCCPIIESISKGETNDEN